MIAEPNLNHPAIGNAPVHSRGPAVGRPTMKKRYSYKLRMELLDEDDRKAREEAAKAPQSYGSEVAACAGDKTGCTGMDSPPVRI